METRKEKIACPYCQHEQEFESYVNIDLDVEPELKAKIMSDELFTFECEECGKKALMAFPCLVSNMELKYMYWLIANFDDEQKKALDDDLKESMKSDNDKKFAGGYRRRITGTINELKEKILIADEGLDDRVMEVLKILCINEVSDQLQSTQLSEVRFNKKEDGGMCLVLVFLDREPALIDITLDMYHKVEKMFGHDIEEKTDKEGFAEIDPYWANEVINDSIVLVNKTDEE